MKELGMRAYRFSVSWPRIFPTGRGRVNPKGIDFYNRLVDELLAANIEPLVTLYHWDLPVALQDEGGWANRAMVEAFSQYAGTMAEALGDRVKHWVIFNEPAVFVLAAYIAGIHPPGLRDGALGMRASHIANLAQAAAFRVMKATGRANNVGTTLRMSSAFPASNSEQDRSAAERYHALTNVWFLEPLLKGTYPEPFLKPVDPGRIGVENGDM
jgi:beta-glucosidase